MNIVQKFTDNFENLLLSLMSAHFDACFAYQTSTIRLHIEIGEKCHWHYVDITKDTDLDKLLKKYKPLVDVVFLNMLSGSSITNQLKTMIKLALYLQLPVKTNFNNRELTIYPYTDLILFYNILFPPEAPTRLIDEKSINDADHAPQNSINEYPVMKKKAEDQLALLETLDFSNSEDVLFWLHDLLRLEDFILLPYIKIHSALLLEGYWDNYDPNSIDRSNTDQMHKVEIALLLKERVVPKMIIHPYQLIS